MLQKTPKRGAKIGVSHHAAEGQIPAVVPAFQTRNLGFARWKGKNDYFPGEYNSAESTLAYTIWCGTLDHPEAELERSMSANRAGNPYVYSIVTRYLAWAIDHYGEARSRKAGTLGNKRLAAELLSNDKDLSLKLAKDVGPNDLRKIQRRLLKRGIARATIHKRMADIRHIFKWAASRELIPATTYASITLLESIHRGKDGSHDPPPREAADPRDFEAVLPFCKPVVRAMLTLQYFTGVRSSNVCDARPSEFEPHPTEPEMLLWIPSRHKTQHAGKTLRVVVGPRAVEAIRPYLKNRPYCFVPHKQRTTRDGTPSTHYTKDSYRRALERAVKRAVTTLTEKKAKLKGKAKAKSIHIPSWFSPHQLRHARAKLVQQRFDLDTAKAALGHSKKAMTEWYAGQDLQRATAAARELG